MPDQDYASPPAPHKKVAAYFYLIAGCAVFGIVAWIFLRTDDIPPAPSAKNNNQARNPYVADAACRECHAEIAEAYNSHPMSRSLQRIADAPDIEDDRNPAEFSPAAHLIYQIRREGEFAVHHEIRTDREGREIYDQSVEIHYALGSGKRGRSYLIKRGELFFASPIAWYTQKKRWDLSPGYSPENNPRFERRVHDLCLRCHVGRVNAQPNGPDTFADPPFRAASIGCQNCHGPGAGHVAYHQGKSTHDGTDPIVNPAKLSPAKRESICLQCHLMGVDTVLNPGKSAYDFQPGGHLNDVMAVFVRRGSSADSRTAVDQALQLRASKCYQESAGRMGCTSCHDPHSVPARGQRIPYYRGRCLECHSGNETTCKLSEQERRSVSAEDSCIVCHMPKYGTSDVPHTAQTNHRIPRRSAETAEDRPGGVDGLRLEDVEIFDSRDVPLPKSIENRAKGLLLARMAESEGTANPARIAETILRPLLKEFPRDAELLDALAAVCAVQNRTDEAVELWTTLLEFEPGHEQALYSLAVLELKQKQYRLAVDHLDRLLKANPWQAKLHLDRARALSELGKTRDAVESAKTAMSRDPSRVEIYEFLAKLHRQLGEASESDRFESIAKRLAESIAGE